MPEGPEIRRAADRIGKVLDGRRVESVCFGLARLQRFEDELTEATVARVETRGKAMLIRFDLGLSLYAHNQLYGRWYVRARGALPDTRRALRVALHTQAHSALLYSASDIAVLTPEEELAHPYLSGLGPDVLDATLTWRELSRRLGLARFRNRALASLYLDQGFAAGIGNYLRSEILFAAGLHPGLRPRDLSLRDRNALARQTLSIPRRAYETGGVTSPPERVARLRAAGAPRKTYRHAVFNRQGAPCPTCGSPVERIEAGARRLYLCPSCQPEQI